MLVQRVGLIPCERYLDVLLVDGKAQVEQLQLAIIPVQQIPPGGAVFASAPHVLSQPIEGSAFFGIPFGIVSICVADISLERRDPVNLVCSLERHGQHGRLRHGGRILASKNTEQANWELALSDMGDRGPWATFS